MVYGALRAGRGFLGYEQPGPIAGFAFWAESGSDQATMGETLAVKRTAHLHVRLPRPGRIRLLREGQVVAQEQGDHLALITPHRGAYRVEVTAGSGGAGEVGSIATRFTSAEGLRSVADCGRMNRA